MISKDLVESIKTHEGFSRTAYRCPTGRMTIGYGRCIDADEAGAGISEAEAEELLINDVERFEEAAQRIVGEEVWSWLSQKRRDVLTEMAFNMGPGNLRKFTKMLAALQAEDYGLAAAEALDSVWAKQVGQRAERLAQRLG